MKSMGSRGAGVGLSAGEPSLIDLGAMAGGGGIRGSGAGVKVGFACSHWYAGMRVCIWKVFIYLHEWLC